MRSHSSRWATRVRGSVVVLVMVGIGALSAPAASGAVPVSAVPVSAVASTAAGPVVAANGQTCEELRIGAQLPVILVHGWHDSPAVWDQGNPSMRQAITTVGGTWVDTFDYTSAHDLWVGDTAVGTAGRLAQRIDCVAGWSRRGGGAGKVLLVGHSMGGLAIRCALKKSCAGYPTGLSDSVAEVITLGTPSLGSFLRGGALTGAENMLFAALQHWCAQARRPPLPFPMVDLDKLVCLLTTPTGFAGSAVVAFQPGSVELALLPNWTGAFPVVSVAGHVRVMASVFGVPMTPTGDAGDLVVGPTSALTAPFDVQATHLKRDISCGDLTLDALLLAKIPIGSSVPTCWHKYEPSSLPFEQAVTQAVTAFRNAHPPYVAGATFAMGPAYVETVAISPDGATLAAGSGDGHLRMWNLADNSVVLDTKPESIWLGSVQFSPDGTRYVTAGTDRVIRIWDARSHALLSTLTGHTQPIYAVAFSPDGRQLASVSVDRTVRLWALTGGSGSLIRTMTGHTGDIDAVAYSPDGSKLATASVDGTIRLWDTGSGALRHVFTGHVGRVMSVAFSPDGRTIASGGADHTVRLWDVDSYLNVGTMVGSTGATIYVNSVTFSPDGSTVIAGSGEQVVRLWDVATRRLTARMVGTRGWVSTVAVNRDATLIASGGEDGVVRLWHSSP